MKLVSTVLFSLFLTFSRVPAALPPFENFTAEMDATGQRFLVHAQINGQPATLAFDTGAETLFLFKPAAERLGLELPEIPSDILRKDGKFPVVDTKPYDVSLFDKTGKMSLPVADFSVQSDVDGCIGWPLFKNSIFQIDVASRTIRSLVEVPAEARQWIALRIHRSSDVLCLELPKPSKPGVILIDTGSFTGVALNRDRWRDWTNANPHAAKTLLGYYMGGAGTVVGEEMWAESLSIGPMLVNNVAVHLASASESNAGSWRFPCQATLGLAALQRLDVIVDGPSGIVYLRPRQGPVVPYAHNRAGVIFTLQPRQKNKPATLGARIVEGGPADKAGIQNGDILLQFNGQTITNANNGPTFFTYTQPVGTKLNFTLKRGNNEFDTVVVLEDLFPTAGSGTNHGAKELPSSQ